MKHAIVVIEIDRHGGQRLVKVFSGKYAPDLIKEANNYAEKTTYKNSGSWLTYSVSQLLECENVK